MTPRFLAPALDPALAHVELPPDEAAHLLRVLRLGPGAAVRVFDGRGREWQAEVAQTTRSTATLRLGDEVPPAPELRRAVSLAVAVLKGDKMDDVVRDAVMLGVARLTPLVSARTEVSLQTLHRAARAERWRRIAVASVKQCGRAVVPIIDDPVALEAFTAATPRGRRAVLVEPSADVPGRHLRELSDAGSIELVVGPEGGWTADEVRAMLDAAMTPVRLGATTLRADAVPIVAVTAWLTIAEEF